MQTTGNVHEVKYMNKTLADVLKRDANNFDLIRLIASISVIYGHSFALIKNVSGTDLLYVLTGVYSGELGLKIFFFLSGLLVVNSAISGKDAYAYTLHRFFRIWPALAFVVLGTAFFIGSLCTRLTLFSYFNEPAVYAYVKHMLMFQSWGTQSLGFYNLPGVFVDNHYKDNVNAPLWTLAIEVFAYILILAFNLVGAFNPKVAILIFAIFVLDTLLPERLIFFWLPKNSFDLSAIPFCFAIGGVLAVYKEKISITISVPIGFFLLCFLFKGWANHIYLVYTFIFMLVTYVASTPVMVNLPRFPDLSYGTYLWGWPVQQTIASKFPEIGFFPFFISSLFISLIMAYISWKFIEKKAIEFGKKSILFFKDNGNNAKINCLKFVLIAGLLMLMQVATKGRNIDSTPIKKNFDVNTKILTEPAFGSVDVINDVFSPKSGSVISISGDKVIIAGNYVDGVNGDAAAGVIVLIDNKPYVANYGGERPDIAKIHNNPKYLKSKFYINIPTSTLGKGIHTVKIKVMASDKSGYYISNWVAQLNII